jgi:hypothetical protein
MHRTMNVCLEILFRSTWLNPRVFCEVRVNLSFVICVYVIDRYLSFCTFSFGDCVVCSSIYGFWLPLWHLRYAKSLALFNLQKYIQNNLQILNSVNIFKANGLLHRTYVTVTALALSLIFIGIIKICHYLLSYRNKGRISREYLQVGNVVQYFSSGLVNSCYRN